MNQIRITASTNRDSSNDVLNVPTDHGFCYSLAKCTIPLLMNNKPVLDDVVLLKHKIQCLSELEADE